MKETGQVSGTLHNAASTGSLWRKQEAQPQLATAGIASIAIASIAIASIAIAIASIGPCAEHNLMAVDSP